MYVHVCVCVRTCVCIRVFCMYFLSTPLCVIMVYKLGLQASKSSCNLMANVLICHFVESNFHGGARGVIFIVVENGHGDTSSNPGRD